MALSRTRMYTSSHLLQSTITTTMSSRLRVRYWVGVLSKDQVQDAVKKGYCEFKNGSKQAFKHVNPHSWFVYYSPGTKPLKVIREEGREAGQPLRLFTAIGQVLPGEPYSIDLGNDDIVYRRNARYVPNTTDAPLEPLMRELSFFKNLPIRKPWGIAFRSGLVEILKSDFYQLCEAMNIDMPKRHHLVFEQSNTNIKKPEIQEENQQPQTNSVTESENGSNTVESTVEDCESIDGSHTSNGGTVLQGIQQQQEIDNVRQLKVDDTNETSPHIEILKENGGESFDPIPDNNGENTGHVLQHQQESTTDDEKENNSSTEETQQKEHHHVP